MPDEQITMLQNKPDPGAALHIVMSSKAPKGNDVGMYVCRENSYVSQTSIIQHNMHSTPKPNKGS